MWRKFCKVATALPAVALAGGMLALSNGAQAAVVLSDFDTGTYYGGAQGWFPYGSIGAGIVAAPAGNGGNTSNWLYQAPGQYYGSMTQQNWAVPAVSAADFAANDQIEFDLIVPGTGPNAWLPNNPGQSFQVEIQTSAGSPSFSTTINTALKDAVQHVVVSYNPALVAAGSGFWNLSFRAEPGYDWGWDGSNSAGIPFAARLYYDNIQLSTVPEPTSLALLGVGAIGLIRRRRA